MIVQERVPGYALIRHTGGIHDARAYVAYCPEALGGCG